MVADPVQGVKTTKDVPLDFGAAAVREVGDQWETNSRCPGEAQSGREARPFLSVPI